MLPTIGPIAIGTGMIAVQKRLPGMSVRVTTQQTMPTSNVVIVATVTPRISEFLSARQ